MLLHGFMAVCFGVAMNHLHPAILPPVANIPEARGLDAMQLITPQPRNGPPFRINFVNRGREYWYNERLAYRRGFGPMLFEWKCPFGVNGYPKLIDGLWYWVRQ